MSNRFDDDLLETKEVFDLRIYLKHYFQMDERKQMRVFKVQNKEGLYSTGGMYAQFKTVGKVWVAKQHALSHLQMIQRYCEKYKQHNVHNPYEGCSLVEYEMTEVNRISL